MVGGFSYTIFQMGQDGRAAEDSGYGGGYGGYGGYGSDNDLDAIVGGFDDLELNFHAEEGVETRDTDDVRDGSESESAGDMTCAICLHSINLPDMAMVKGCDHLYCACCILQWTLHKSEASCVCPTCKRPFSYLLTYRALDGTLNDFPMEESVWSTSGEPSPNSAT